MSKKSKNNSAYAFNKHYDKILAERKEKLRDELNIIFNANKLPLKGEIDK